MKKEDLVYLCTAVGNLSGIPVRLYEGDELCFYHNVVRLPKDPIQLVWHEIRTLSSHVSYYVTPRFLYYGIVAGGNQRIVVGPSRQTVIQDQELREMAFQLIYLKMILRNS